MVIVAGLEVEGVLEALLLARSLKLVLGTTVIPEVPVDTPSLCCGDFAIDTGIIVIFVGVFAGVMAILFTGIFTFVGEPGSVAITALPGDTIP